MDDSEVRRYWESNADAWTKLSRAGFDVCRDYQNTPAFFDLLPDVNGLSGVDLGCGEGYNTRLLAARGARVTALDLSWRFIHAALEQSRDGIQFLAASMTALPFADGAFDFATGFMSLMDAAAPDRVLPEVARVVRPGGFLQFSLVHPCFAPPQRRIVRDPSGRAIALEVSRYFDRTDGEIEEWLFSAAPAEAKAGLRPFQVPRFHATMADWLNAIHDSGFHVERCVEPCADPHTAASVRGLDDTRVAPNFILFRCRRR